jgi:hypothetical protein
MCSRGACPLAPLAGAGTRATNRARKPQNVPKFAPMGLAPSRPLRSRVATNRALKFAFKGIVMDWSDLKRCVSTESFAQAYAFCVHLKMPSSNGKSYLTDAADRETEVYAKCVQLLFDESDEV